MQQFAVILDKVLQHPQLPTCVKSAIYKAKLNSYLPFSEFLKEISDAELTELQNIFAAKDEENSTLGFLIVLVLAQIEGVFVESQEQGQEMYTTGIIGVNLESLYRKGLVEFYRENLNFLSEDKPVAKLTQKGNEYKNTLKDNDDV